MIALAKIINEPISRVLEMTVAELNFWEAAALEFNSRQNATPATPATSDGFHPITIEIPDKYLNPGSGGPT